MPNVRAATAYILVLCTVAVAGLAAGAYLLEPRFGWTALGTVTVLAAVAFACQRLPVVFGRGGRDSVEVSDVAILSALVLAGPAWALVVAVPSMIYGEPLRVVYNAATRTLTVLAAGFVLHGLSEPLFFSGGGFGVHLVYAALAAGLAYQVLDAAINCGLLRLKYGTPFGESAREMVLPVVPSDAAAIVTSVVVALAMVAYGPVAAVVLFCGAAGALVSLHVINAHRGRVRERVRELEGRVKALAREREEMAAAPLAFAARLTESLEKRDGRTARLAAASAVYAGDVAGELCLDPAVTGKLRTAALLQDVGLAALPDALLLASPGKLNALAKRQLEEHTALGERMLAAAPGFEEAAKWVRWHHERVDGTGYPDRIRGEWLPLEARILAVASAYASMVLDAAHGPGMAPDQARQKLVAQAQNALDGGVVRTLLRILDREDESYAAAADGRFVFPAAVSGGRSAGSGAGGDGVVAAGE